MVIFLELQDECMPVLIDPCGPSINVPFRTCSSCTRSEWGALFHKDSAYFLGVMFDVCVSPIISASSSAITPSIA